MRPWTTLDHFETADGRIELRRRGESEFLITLGGRVLMNSAASRSESELARLACAPLAGRPRPRLLVGGLGMGVTLRAALEALPAGAEVVVAELHERVVRWCRGPLAPLAGVALDDPRLEVRVCDVADAIAAGPQTWDAILLDLYAGPRPRSRRARGPRRDEPHFGARALARARAALRRDGILAVWSEDPDRDFERRLREAGFAVERRRPGRGGRRHVVYLARVAPPASRSRLS